MRMRETSDGVMKDYNFIIFLPFTLFEEETKEGGILVETLLSISGLVVFWHFTKAKRNIITLFW